MSESPYRLPGALFVSGLLVLGLTIGQPTILTQQFPLQLLTLILSGTDNST